MPHFLISFYNFNILINLFLLSRFGCTYVHMVLVLVSVTANHMMRSSMTVAYPSQIPPGTPAFVDNIILNMTEWIGVITILVFLCSFYVEFEDFELVLVGSQQQEQKHEVGKENWYTVEELYREKSKLLNE